MTLPMKHDAIDKNSFGTTAEGQAVDCYTLRNSRGTTARLISLGATLTELWTPDRQGRMADIVLGFDNLKQYETQSPYFGSTVGRVAFRIAGGRFTLDGKPYQLAMNQESCHLHGGPRGFSWVVWRAERLERDEGPALRFTYRSPDGDQGYPGAMDASVVYTLTQQDELRIDHEAVADRPTIVNLTHHSYFNLAGAGQGDILDHVLQLDADRWIPADKPDEPSGAIASVAGTPYDFTRPTAIGARIRQTNPNTRGYDLCYLHNQPEGRLSQIAALEYEPTGRRMEVLTNEPAVVLYTANYLDGTLRGKNGKVYGQHAGVCLETGRPPDAANHPNFPSIVLRPGETYRHTCVYRFSTI